MYQLLSTFDRSGSSKGKTTLVFCSGERLVYSVVTRVSDVPVSFLGTAAATAALAVPSAAVFKNCRRSTESQSGHRILVSPWPGLYTNRLETPSVSAGALCAVH